MTFSEPNSVIRPTGAEAGEFLDEPPLSQEREGGDDPTRRITGASPLPRTSDGDDESVADGYEMLEQDRREIEEQFRAVEQDDDVVVRELCEHLTGRIRREEAVLVPALRRVDGGDAALAERVTGENSELETMIAELYDSATPERIPTLISALHGAVSAHLEAVESAIVPALRAAGIDARQLAHDLEAVTAP